MSDCLKNYINNKPILFQICEVSRNKIDSLVRNKVANLQKKHAILDKIQSGICTIVEAADIWKKLFKNFEKS